VRKKVSLLLIIFGIGFLAYGGYGIWNSKQAEQETLKEAKVAITEKRLTGYDIASAEEFKPTFGEAVGILSLPDIDAELPIVEGTDEDDLAKGVGHYSTSAYPGEKDQIVLSGHRDTVFRRLGDLEIGDIITIELPYGKFDYKIESTDIVEADDRTVIRPTAPDEILTVTTCYPFNFVGNAPQRYIIYAVPVS